MRTYVDSSVLLRVVLGSAGALQGWRRLAHPVSSALIEVESLRTLDRLRLVEGIPQEEIAARREVVFDFVERIDIVDLTRAVITRASQPLPLPLKTLDALHLATAMILRESGHDPIQMATHDDALACAAAAMGIPVIGI